MKFIFFKKTSKCNTILGKLQYEPLFYLSNIVLTNPKDVAYLFWLPKKKREELSFMESPSLN